MTERVVILGAGGMLGRAWAELAPGLWSGREVRALDRARCDVTDEAAVRAAIVEGDSLVINCAAYTNVDGAEADEAAADRLNARAPGLLARRCRETGAKLLHYSTDYVFAGDAAAPYRAEDPRRPINAYGRSKARGEEAIEQEPGASGPHLIVRTSWLYAPHGKNFVRTIAQACREKPSLRVVNDQRGRPTSCDSLVRLSAGLVGAGASGVIHGCDAGECTWFDLARAVVERINAACEVVPCSSAEFPRPAARPAYSVLDLSKTENLLGPLPDWRVSLARALTKVEVGRP